METVTNTHTDSWFEEMSHEDRVEALDRMTEVLIPLDVESELFQTLARNDDEMLKIHCKLNGKPGKQKPKPWPIQQPILSRPYGDSHPLEVSLRPRISWYISPSRINPPKQTGSKTISPRPSAPKQIFTRTTASKQRLPRPTASKQSFSWPTGHKRSFLPSPNAFKQSSSKGTADKNKICPCTGAAKTTVITPYTLERVTKLRCAALAELESLREQKERMRQNSLKELITKTEKIRNTQRESRGFPKPISRHSDLASSGGSSPRPMSTTSRSPSSVRTTPPKSPPKEKKLPAALVKAQCELEVFDWMLNSSMEDKKPSFKSHKGSKSRKGKQSRDGGDSSGPSTSGRSGQSESRDSSKNLQGTSRQPSPSGPNTSGPRGPSRESKDSSKSQETSCQSSPKLLLVSFILLAVESANKRASLPSDSCC